MAHHKDTLKAIRQTKKITEANIVRRSRMRSSIKNVITAIDNKDGKAAGEALRMAQKELFRGVAKGIIKSAAASRKFSRLNAMVKSIGGSANTKPKSEKKAAPKKTAANKTSPKTKK